MTKYKKGRIVKGTVSGIEKYGVFIKLEELYNGLIHISEVSHSFVKDINNYVKIGDEIYVEILEVDENTCQLKLSIKNINFRRKMFKNKNKIEETTNGFNTLQQMLPIWIDKKVKR